MVVAGQIPRVLVVDDEQIIANTLTQILNLSGYSATAAYSGEKAVEVAPALRPDILISDVIMFGMTGIDAAIAIQHSVPGCRVVLLSGQASTADLLHRAEGQGCRFEVLAKPVHPRVLLSMLRKTA
jgi:CheY-like chemotaxis protein